MNNINYYNSLCQQRPAMSLQGTDGMNRIYLEQFNFIRDWFRRLLFKAQHHKWSVEAAKNRTLVDQDNVRQNVTTPKTEHWLLHTLTRAAHETLNALDANGSQRHALFQVETTNILQRDMKLAVTALEVMARDDAVGECIRNGSLARLAVQQQHITHLHSIVASRNRRNASYQNRICALEVDLLHMSMFVKHDLQFNWNAVREKCTIDVTRSTKDKLVTFKDADKVLGATDAVMNQLLELLILLGHDSQTLYSEPLTDFLSAVMPVTLPARPRRTVPVRLPTVLPTSVSRASSILAPLVPVQQQQQQVPIPLLPVVLRPPAVAVTVRVEQTAPMTAAEAGLPAPLVKSSSSNKRKRSPNVASFPAPKSAKSAEAETRLT